MSLIDEREDERALLAAEDAAIREAAINEPRQRTPLDDLARMLGGVHETTEGDGGDRRGDDQSEGGG